MDRLPDLCLKAAWSGTRAMTYRRVCWSSKQLAPRKKTQQREARVVSYAPRQVCLTMHDARIEPDQYRTTSIMKGAIWEHRIAKA